MVNYIVDDLEALLNPLAKKASKSTLSAAHYKRINRLAIDAKSSNEDKPATESPVRSHRLHG
jgi:hypothetical protein